MAVKVWRYVCAVAVFCLYCLAADYFFGNACPQMALVGLPCPGCGLTRAGVLFFMGRFAESFKMNPMFAPVAAFALCLLVCTLVRPTKTKYFYAPGVVLIAVLFAVYVYRMKYLFPNQFPMTANKDSVLFKIIFLRKGNV